MSSIIPPELMAHIYGSATEDMMLRVLDGPDGPGLVLLSTLRQLSQSQIDALAGDIDKEARARIDSDASMSSALSGLSSALTAESKSRGDADKAIADRLAAVERSLQTLLSENARRWEFVRGTVATAGNVVSVNFANPFTTMPAVLDIPTWSGEQAVLAAATEITLTGVKVAVKRSKGTLALSSGPFENAPAGTPFVLVALGS